MRRLVLTFKKKLWHKKSHEFGASIIKSAYTGEPFTFNGSVLNKGNIVKNLPEHACVEVPVTINKNVFVIEDFGEIPEELAAINRTNINVQIMTIKAARERKMEYVYMAAALDPHTSSELTIDQIKEMCDELYLEHRNGGWLPDYI